MSRFTRSKANGPAPLTGANTIPVADPPTPLPVPAAVDPVPPSAPAAAPVPVEMMQLFRDMLVNQQNQTAILQQNQMAILQQVMAPAPPPSSALVIRTFWGMKPKTFSGTDGALAAEEWISSIIDLLRSADVPPEAQVDAVKIQLEDLARAWWQGKEVRLMKPIPWGVFEERFFERFFPETAKLDLEQEFYNLKQRDLSVEDYSQKFTRLSRFAPEVASNPISMARRFEQGLTLEIQRMLSLVPHDSYDEIRRTAMRFERTDNRVKKVSGKRSSSVSSKGATSSSKVPPAKRQALAPVPPQTVCGFCKKLNHSEKDCRQKLGLCLICGSPDHRVGACPRAQYRGTPPKGRRLAFSMTAEEAEASDQVITG